MLKVPSPCRSFGNLDIFLPVGPFFVNVEGDPYLSASDKIFLFSGDNAIIIIFKSINLIKTMDIYRFKAKNLQNHFDLTEGICCFPLHNNAFKYVDPENKFFVCTTDDCRMTGILDLETLTPFLDKQKFVATSFCSRMIFTGTKYAWLAECDLLHGFSLHIWRQRFEDLRKQSGLRELFWFGKIDSYVQNPSTYSDFTDLDRFPSPFVFVCDEDSNSFFLRMQKASKLVLSGEPILRTRSLLNFNACFYKDNVIFWRPLANHNLLIFPPISMSYIISKKSYLSLRPLGDPLFAECRCRLSYVFLDPEEDELIVGDYNGEMKVWSNYFINTIPPLVYFAKPGYIRLHPTCNLFQGVPFRKIKMSKESKNDPFIRRRIELAHPYRF